MAGRLPERGEIFSGPGPFEIEVLEADPQRLKRLRISQRKELPAPRAKRRRTQAPDAANTETLAGDMPSTESET
jgi:magnesium and cobalt transporter